MKLWSGERLRESGSSLALIGIELALATALLISAGLMERTLWRLAHVDSGIHAGGVVSALISAGPSRCGNSERCSVLVQDLSRVVAGLPGVTSVNWSNAAPLDKEFSAVSVDIQDHPKPPGAPSYVLWQTAASPGYFHALGIPLRMGRVFNDGDRQGGAPPIVISESTAKRFWPNESAIGKRIRPMSDKEWRTVTGVVGDVAQYSLTGFPSWVDGVQYVPIAQSLPWSQNIQLAMFVESAQPAATMLALAGQVRQALPDVVVYRMTTLEEIRSKSVADQQSMAWLLALLAGLGFVLGIVGVYGVISHRAAQRTREIGIRMALGAGAGKAIRMVLRETLLVSVAGIGAGVATGIGLSRFLRSLLFGVTGHDTFTLLTCPAILLAAAMLAAAVPGVRASRTDPAVTLREE